MARCSYRYADEARCLYDDAALIDGDFCAAHRAIVADERRLAAARVRNKANYAKRGMPIRRPKKNGSRIVQPSRVQYVKDIIDKLPEVPGPGDPTAPWCTCPDVGQVERCGECDKPTYARWSKGKVRHDE